MTRQTAAVVFTLLCMVGLMGCQPGTTAVAGREKTTAVAGREKTTALAGPRTQYVDLVDRVAARHATVWVEVDLVKAWQAGTSRYGDVVNIAVKLASRPGVAGIKVADELGYHDGIETPQQAGEFLAKVSKDIRSRLPGTKILVDMVVPQLGCLPWVVEPTTESERRVCSTAQGVVSPASTISAVDGYLRSGDVDVLDLSVGLRDRATYDRWNTTSDEAMRAIWTEVVRRQWGALVTLQARKALAHPGTYVGGAAKAEQDLRTFVDIPLANGAQAVDIWTWSQPYKGTTYRLSNPGLGTNPLVAGLARRQVAGARLFTHMTPSSLVVSTEADVVAATGIFTDIFVAAGAG
jgi:hypothetical protein